VHPLPAGRQLQRPFGQHHLMGNDDDGDSAVHGEIKMDQQLSVDSTRESGRDKIE
jgi:hypothetical protein